jgi:formamidopyrimidine-DNA glycosylase
MPELPEVETTVRGLAKVLDGATLSHVEARRADLRWPMPVDLRQRMTGAHVTGLGRRAKYGLIHTDRDDTLIFHLGMSGHWRIDPSEIKTHDHVILQTHTGHTLALNDPRRFGSLDLMPTADLAQYKAFQTMGPEPLGDGLTPAYLKAALKGRSSKIKSMLLDQRIVAGLGNIYVCEALHMAGIAPDKAAGAVSDAKIKQLIPAIQSILTAAIEAGGSTLRDFAAPDGELGYFFNQWRVYGREGRDCGCGTVIKRRVDGGRSTFYCPKCQR